MQSVNSRATTQIAITDRFLSQDILGSQEVRVFHTFVDQEVSSVVTLCSTLAWSQIVWTSVDICSLWSTYMQQLELTKVHTPPMCAVIMSSTMQFWKTTPFKDSASVCNLFKASPVESAILSMSAEMFTIAFSNCAIPKGDRKALTKLWKPVLYLTRGLEGILWHNLFQTPLTIPFISLAWFTTCIGGTRYPIVHCFMSYHPDSRLWAFPSAHSHQKPSVKQQLVRCKSSAHKNRCYWGGTVMVVVQLVLEHWMQPGTLVLT